MRTKVKSTFQLLFVAFWFPSLLYGHVSPCLLHSLACVRLSYIREALGCEKGWLNVYAKKLMLSLSLKILSSLYPLSNVVSLKWNPL